MKRSIYSEGTLFLVTENIPGTFPILLQARDARDGSLKWQRDIGPGSEPWLIASGNTVYVSTAGFVGYPPGFLSAYDATSGALLWTNPWEDQVTTSPVIYEGSVYASSVTGVLWAIDARDGTDQWQFDVGSLSSEITGGTPIAMPIPGPRHGFAPAISKGVAFVSADDGVVYAIKLKTHELSWYQKTDVNDLSTPAVINGSVYFSGCYLRVTDNGQGVSSFPCYLYQISESNGTIVHQTSVSSDDALLAATADYLVISNGVRVSLLATSSLEEVASFPEGLVFAAFGESVMYLTDGGEGVSAFQYDFDSKQISLLWSGNLRTRGNPSLLLGGGELFVIGSPVSSLGSSTLTAIGEIPNATPIANQRSVDLSGLAACDFPDPVDWSNLSGTPAKTITNQTGALTANGVASVDPPTAEEKRAGYSSAMEPWMDFDAVPEGGPVPDETKAAILSTTGALLACLNRQSDGDYSGFFSNDFLRRDYVRFVLDDLGYPTSWFAGGLFPPFVLESSDFRMLEDGRVAVMADPPAPRVDNFAMFVVFAEQEGHWVVDEVIRVGAGALQG